MTNERVSLTTGANSGIGFATALELARRGLRSVGTVRSRAKAHAVTAIGRRTGPGRGDRDHGCHRLRFMRASNP